MARPQLQDLSTDLQKIFDPEKAKMLPFIAKGAAPLPPPLLVSSWCYLLEEVNSELAETAKQSLLKYPETMLLPVLKSELPAWVLETLGAVFRSNENLLEAILLNEYTPDSLFVDVARTCSEKLSNLIANNQERIITKPDIILSLEANPKNLKSNTDRLRQFLRLAGIQVGAENVAAEVELMQEDASLEQDFLEALEKGEEFIGKGKVLTEDEKLNLMQYISTLSIGARVKLAMKGNKEVRTILIRDTNKIIALAVLKSPRLTENEVAMYTTLKSLSEDVVRAIAVNPTWTKNYGVKLGLCYHPKTPLQFSIPYIKFLTMRDLQRVAKDKNVPGTLVKAAKQLVSIKRK